MPAGVGGKRAHLAAGRRQYKRRWPSGGGPTQPRDGRLPHGRTVPNLPNVKRTFGPAPTAAEMEAIARAALARLPAHFAEHLGDIVLSVEEFAEQELLEELELEDAFDLTGVYQGVPLHLRSVEHTGNLPDRIRLFRRPILDEWAARGDETLEHLIAHVLVHEVGHHFGLSDDVMHSLEDAAG